MASKYSFCPAFGKFQTIHISDITKGFLISGFLSCHDDSCQRARVGIQNRPPDLAWRWVKTYDFSYDGPFEIGISGPSEGVVAATHLNARLRQHRMGCSASIFTFVNAMV
jgi:hypothetical protein